MAPKMSNDQKLVAVRPGSSAEKQQSQTIQRVALDQSSIDYLSRMIQDKLNKEFSARDQKLLGQVNQMIKAAISEYASDGVAQSDRLPAISNANQNGRRESLREDHQHLKRDSSSGKETKIPRIKLPKASAPTDAPSSRATKASPIHDSNANQGRMSARRIVQSKSLDEPQFDGVQYPQCRTAVSATAHDVECFKALQVGNQSEINFQISHAFGYNGDMSKSNGSILSKNVHWIGHSHLVYPTASLVIVLHVATASQAFFGGHTEHVSCISVNPANQVIASSQTGSDCKVRIWDYQRQLSGTSSNSCQKISISSSVKAIGGLNFSGDGKYLLVYASEDVRSIFILDWAKNNVMCCVKSGHPDSCEVFFDPFSYLPFNEEDVSSLSPSQSYLPGCYNIVSRSSRQLKLWTMKSCLATEPTKSILKNNKHMQAIEYVLESGNLNQGNKPSEYSAVVCTSIHRESSLVFAGMVSGSIQIWVQVKEDTSDAVYGSTWVARGRLLMVIEKAHDCQITNFDFISNESCCKLASCDKDGVLNVWDIDRSTEISKDRLLTHVDAVQIEDVGVRGLLWRADGDQVLAATVSNSIVAVNWPNSRARKAGDDHNSSVSFDFIVRGHVGKIRKLAVNHIRDSIVATIGSDKMIKMWDTFEKTFICHLSVDNHPTVVFFSADGHCLLVGNEVGELVVLRSPTFSNIVETGRVLSADPISDWSIVYSKDLGNPSVAGTFNFPITIVFQLCKIHTCRCEKATTAKAH